MEAKSSGIIYRATAIILVRNVSELARWVAVEGVEQSMCLKVDSARLADGFSAGCERREIQVSA